MYFFMHDHEIYLCMNQREISQAWSGGIPSIILWDHIRRGVFNECRCRSCLDIVRFILRASIANIDSTWGNGCNWCSTSFLGSWMVIFRTKATPLWSIKLAIPSLPSSHRRLPGPPVYISHFKGDGKPPWLGGPRKKQHAPLMAHLYTLVYPGRLVSFSFCRFTLKWDFATPSTCTHMIRGIRVQASSQV